MLNADSGAGDPLALALVAERVRGAPEAAFEPADAPDVVGALLRRVVDEAPDDEHRLRQTGVGTHESGTSRTRARSRRRCAAPCR